MTRKEQLAEAAWEKTHVPRIPIIIAAGKQLLAETGQCSDINISRITLIPYTSIRLVRRRLMKTNDWPLPHSGKGQQKVDPTERIKIVLAARQRLRDRGLRPTQPMIAKEAGFSLHMVGRLWSYLRESGDSDLLYDDDHSREPEYDDAEIQAAIALERANKFEYETDRRSELGFFRIKRIYNVSEPRYEYLYE